MNSGLNAGNPAVVAAFRTALLHQALTAVAIFAVLGLAWLSLRTFRSAGVGRAAPARDHTRAEPAGRKLLAIGFGNLWLFDGFLQAQPKMALGLPSQVIEPTAAASPPWVQHVVNWGAASWSYHPMQAGAAAVWIQVGLGIWILAAPRGLMSRLAGVVSVGWGLVVWVFGESFGGIFAPGLSWLSGAPGAVAVYVAAGVLLALPERAWRTPRPGGLTMAGLGLFLAGMAVLQAWPGRGSWQGAAHGQPGTLAGMALSMSLTPQPGFLSRWLAAFGAFDQAHGFAVNLVAVAALAAIGVAFGSGRPRLIRPALVAFGILCLADWVLVQDLGFLGGLGTDPGSMLPFILLAAAGYLALTRVGAVPQVQPAERDAPASEAAAARARRWRPRPAELRERVVTAGAWMVAALGGAGLIVLGAVPMAIAQASPNADAILAQSIAGRPALRQFLAPGFTLTNQFGRPVTLAGLRGKVVLLTFINPACRTGCPPVWRELSQAVQLTGAGARQVAIVAIVLSQVPAPVAGLAAFDRRQHLTGLADWQYLTGTSGELERVWQAYGITSQDLAAGPMSARATAYVIGQNGTVRAEYRTGPGPGTAAISSSFAVLFADATRQALGG
jgi:cytochrome oxidase Cu insertion factor (SCO1/SenC/PrrC family)